MLFSTTIPPSLKMRAHDRFRGWWDVLHHHQPISTRWGGVCPSSRFCYFDATRRAIPPSSCCFRFNTARRGMPPPCRVFVSFLTCSPPPSHHPRKRVHTLVFDGGGIAFYHYWPTTPENEPVRLVFNYIILFLY